MADALKVDIKGLNELQAKLEKMSQDMAAKSIVSAAYTANKPMVDAIKNNIASNGLVDTGLLQQSITRKKIIYGKDGKVVIITGVNKSVKGVDKNGKPRVPWRYANVLEPKYKFVQSGFDESKNVVVDKFVSALASRIKKFEKNGGGNV
jgi:hypothetical protein